MACRSFLQYFVDIFCHVSGGDQLLWPQGRTVKQIHDREFKHWLLIAHGQPEGAVPHPYPSLSTFYRALSESRFKHVKMRKENFHTRCDQ